MKALFSGILLLTTVLLLAQNPILPLNTPYNQITNNSYSDWDPWSLDECPEALEPNFHDSMTIPFLMEMTKQ